MKRFAACALFLCSAMHLVAADRQVAITYDDLPRGADRGPRTLPAVKAMTERLLRPYRDGKIPVTGFVIQGNADDLGLDGLRQILDIWLDYGADLGNHSHSHLNIEDHSLADYTADILKGEPVLRVALAAHGKTLRYYRHPFLRTGSTPEIKRRMQAFLDSHGYRVAPVTIDTDDYLYARAYTNPKHRDRARREYIAYMESMAAFFEKRSVEVIGREVPQILLVHASQLNADLAPELLAMFRRRGYRFISLDQALADPAYKLPDGYVGEKGISWIHRWGVAKAIPLAMEPGPAQWLLDAWRER